MKIEKVSNSPLQFKSYTIKTNTVKNKAFLSFLFEKI